MSNQPLKINKIHTKPSSSSTVENVSSSPLSLPRKSNRQLLSYTFSGEKAVRAACNEKKGRDVEVKIMSIEELKETVHKAEKKLIEYTEIHISNNTKFKSVGERILLTLSAKSMFAADVGYHKSCYDVFRSPKWNKKKSVEKNNCHQSSIDKLLNLIEYVVVVKKEIYLSSVQGVL